MELEITRPDDMHLHLRDGEAMASVLPHTAARFARAIVMPNLVPPVTDTRLAAAYRERILAALPAAQQDAFSPLMALYLTDDTSAATVRDAAEADWVIGFKLYPAGATTNSASGVTRIEAVFDAVEAMAEHDVPLLVHGEVTHADVDVFDREAAFIDEVLEPLRRRVPGLRLVFEHVTSRAAVEYVRACPERTAATITPQHLMLNRNAMFQGGLRPHHYCLPVLKREGDREALVEAAISGDPRFFLGTDSAPHARGDKESACGCAGVYSAHAGIELYAEIFEDAGALDRLEAFASHFGADFYGLPRNGDSIRLRRDAWAVPDAYPFAASTIVPFRAGTQLRWRLDGPSSSP
jgi:dihydroorotase